jgi:HAD superfamily hydrolase (TIGR01490 family)
MAKVAFFDIAGTLVAGNPWDSMLVHPEIDRSQVRWVYAQIIPIWLARKAHLISDATFRHYWILAMARLLKGWSKPQADTLFTHIVTEQMAVHDRGLVIEHLQQHKRNGEHVVLVSGLFDGIVQAFAQQLDADGAIGSKLGFHANICTGRIVGATIGGRTKLNVIRDYLITNGFTDGLEECYAYADSFSDAPMLSAVGNPVATYPDDALRVLATKNRWTILAAK